MGHRAGLFRGFVAISAIMALVAVAPFPETGAALVAADHVSASRAGADVLSRGGNAVDAAVAAALAAGVVQPAGSGLGGGGFALGRLGPSEPAFAVDFREVAPAGAARDMFRGPDGVVIPGLSTLGGKAIAVPSEPRGLAELVRRFGKLSLVEDARPAVRLAQGGFEIGPHLALSLASTEIPAIRSLFSIDGRLAARGDWFARPALAKAISRWARSGGESLHVGPDADAIAAAARAAGGVLTSEDLAAVKVVDREALRGRFGKYTILTMPPPSSGGVAILEALGVLEGADLVALGHNSSEYLHLLSEVFGHVFADRAHHLGDPAFVEVPVERLLSPARRDEIKGKIDPKRTFDVDWYGPRIAPPLDAGTQHISVVDRWGGAVALTTTINTSFGSGVVVDSLGLVLNNQMDDFSAAPGVPNAFGLVGTEANAIAPGKRPLSSMSPTVVLDEAGEVVLVVGASGGSTIITGTLQVLLNVLVFGLDPEEAVSAPRIHHQWLPRAVVAEPGIPKDVRTALTAMGHEVVERELPTAVQVVLRDGTVVSGASDPRKGGRPAAP